MKKYRKAIDRIVNECPVLDIDAIRRYKELEIDIKKDAEIQDAYYKAIAERRDYIDRKSTQWKKKSRQITGAERYNLLAQISLDIVKIRKERKKLSKKPALWMPIKQDKINYDDYAVDIIPERNKMEREY